MNKLIVSKFGGTSMANAECMRRSAAVAKSRGSKIIVVSATSGTTNQLIELSKVAATGDWEKSLQILTEIRKKHLMIAEDLKVSANILNDLTDLLDRLDTLAQGISMLMECSKRAFDRLQSYGERLSSTLMVKAVSDCWEGQRNVSFFDIREVILTDSYFGRATPNLDEIKKRAAHFWPHIKEDEVVYVTQGFIGQNEKGQTTTLGRGGSDYSAALIGEAVDADCIEIWTDVAGISTTDPRIHKNARAIDEITFQEASEMAVFGAKVLHPTTLTPAMRKDIPVFVGSSFSPEEKGTWIYKRTEAKPPIRAIALKKDQCLLTLKNPRMMNAYGFLARIFDVFEAHKVSVDSVTTSEISVAMTVDNSALENRELFEALELLGEVMVEEGFSLVSLIGNQINHTAGLGKHIFSSISDINVRMICLGASKHNLCLLVAENEGNSVVQKLHETLIENFAPMAHI